MTHLFSVIGKRNITDLKTRDLLIILKKAETSGHNELNFSRKGKQRLLMRNPAPLVTPEHLNQSWSRAITLYQRVGFKVVDSDDIALKMKRRPVKRQQPFE
ncbi:hypothetical protein KU74_15160 [Pectobacterium brasiliense]|uniref:Uncharacterized protein n=1 Tax=Pectobacterium brasiliense TaxID=180957 RepID=A0A0M2F0C7_9GAMM|nr:hypothetical protein KU74_15160 [Pectobacterium brasiliense]